MTFWQRLFRSPFATYADTQTQTQITAQAVTPGTPPTLTRFVPVTPNQAPAHVTNTPTLVNAVAMNAPADDQAPVVATTTPADATTTPADATTTPADKQAPAVATTAPADEQAPAVATTAVATTAPAVATTAPAANAFGLVTQEPFPVIGRPQPNCTNDQRFRYLKRGPRPRTITNQKSPTANKPPKVHHGVATYTKNGKTVKYHKIQAPCNIKNSKANDFVYICSTGRVTDQQRLFFYYAEAQTRRYVTINGQNFLFADVMAGLDHHSSLSHVDATRAVMEHEGANLDDIGFHAS